MNPIETAAELYTARQQYASEDIHEMTISAPTASMEATQSTDIATVASDYAALMGADSFSAQQAAALRLGKDSATATADGAFSAGQLGDIVNLLLEYGIVKNSDTGTFAAQSGITTLQEAEDAAYLAYSQGGPTASNPAAPSGYTYSTLSVNLYPEGTPQPTDVHQNQIGDCGLDATLAGFASSNPQAIENSIKANNTTPPTWAVTLHAPNGSLTTINVDDQFPVDGSGNQLLDSGNGGGATWATIMNKALAIYNIQNNNALGGDGDGVKYGNLDGIDPGKLMYAITGNGASGTGGIGISHESDQQLYNTMSTALADGQVITAGSKFGGSQPLPGIVDSHFYSVTNVSMVNGVPMVTVRNPWGESTPDAVHGNDGNTFDTNTAGYTVMSMHDFKVAFGNAKDWKDMNGGDMYISGQPVTPANAAEDSAVGSAMTTAVRAMQSMPAASQTPALVAAMAACVAAAGSGDLTGFQTAFAQLRAAYPAAGVGDGGAGNDELAINAAMQLVQGGLGGGGVLQPTADGTSPGTNPSAWMAEQQQA